MGFEDVSEHDVALGVDRVEVIDICFGFFHGHLGGYFAVPDGVAVLVVWVEEVSMFLASNHEPDELLLGHRVWYPIRRPQENMATYEISIETKSVMG